MASPHDEHNRNALSVADRDASSTEEQSYAVEVFYDGACPLCRREIAFLRKLDRGQRLRLTDISGNEFQIENYDRSMQELMKRS